MKLSYVLLLALVAMVTSDSDYYQNSQPQEGDSPNQYYNRRSSGSQKGGLTGILKRFFGIGASRRQFTGPGTGTGFGGATGGGVGVQQAPVFITPLQTGGITAGSLAPFLFLSLLFGLGIGALFLAFSSLDFNNSGRGLDTDEWEVDQSVWMNQLQKDFEDSWSTE